MSIFGAMDAALIPTNPFWIEKGEYEAEVTKAVFKENREKQRQLVIEYTITDEASEFCDKKASQYFTLPDPDMTLEAFELLPADEKKKMRQTLANMKRTLCGNENNSSQRGLGVNAEDLNDAEWDPEVIVGTPVTMGISNYGPTNEGVNVRWVNLRD